MQVFSLFLQILFYFPMSYSLYSLKHIHVLMIWLDLFSKLTFCISLLQRRLFLPCFSTDFPSTKNSLCSFTISLSLPSK
jgi:hypothetical protein